jgi:hypothetical protein
MRKKLKIYDIFGTPHWSWCQLGEIVTAPRPKMICLDWQLFGWLGPSVDQPVFNDWLRAGTSDWVDIVTCIDLKQQSKNWSMSVHEGDKRSRNKGLVESWSKAFVRLLRGKGGLESVWIDQFWLGPNVANRAILERRWIDSKAAKGGLQSWASGKGGLAWVCLEGCWKSKWLCN